MQTELHSHSVNSAVILRY